MTAFPAKVCLEVLHPRAACGWGYSHEQARMGRRGEPLPGDLGPACRHTVHTVKAHARLRCRCRAQRTRVPGPIRRPITGLANTAAGVRTRMARNRADRAFTATTLGRSREKPEFRATASSARSGSVPDAFGRALAGNVCIHRSVDRSVRKNRKIRDLRSAMSASMHGLRCGPLSSALTLFRDLRSGLRRGPHFLPDPAPPGIANANGGP